MAQTVVLDPLGLFESKILLKAGDRDLEVTSAQLEAQATDWLSQGPRTVTSKAIMPPEGDKHDYASQAPYWWTSNTPDGFPYIQKDGIRNPAVDSKLQNYPPRILSSCSTAGRSLHRSPPGGGCNFLTAAFAKAFPASAAA